jgi:hypothetical protein
MSEPSKDGLVMREFPGLVNNMDPRDLPPGVADVQKNLLSRIRGQLTVRRGLRDVKFEE